MRPEVFREIQKAYYEDIDDEDERRQYLDALAQNNFHLFAAVRGEGGKARQIASSISYLATLWVLLTALTNECMIGTATLSSQDLTDNCCKPSSVSKYFFWILPEDSDASGTSLKPQPVTGGRVIAERLTTSSSTWWSKVRLPERASTSSYSTRPSMPSALQTTRVLSRVASMPFFWRRSDWHLLIELASTTMHQMWLTQRYGVTGHPTLPTPRSEFGAFVPQSWLVCYRAVIKVQDQGYPCVFSECVQTREDLKHVR